MIFNTTMIGLGLPFFTIIFLSLLVTLIPIGICNSVFGIHIVELVGLIVKFVDNILQ
jgi:hypothetical protein